ncbi:ParB-like nuclease domain-containing protein [Arboricoccus pini]|uniref:ParB-like nuclease domain-containing protein n=1 Tax=Arboricoccus pini TaxID=1963835 RepID=A0A212R6Z0_9PROT|nr:ParB N-terminal domain-containing protein [Arboricoccus pini]SNB67783.1 ParB-like nuclease domain-containing protein [Arboricoccus pini]
MTITTTFSFGDGHPPAQIEVERSEQPTRRSLHALATIFPKMSQEAFDDLVADIKEHGQREPITVHGVTGEVIDGRHRYEACLKLGLEPVLRVFGGKDEELPALVMSLNSHRRMLTTEQRSMVAAKMATLAVGRPAQEMGPAGPINSDSEEEAPVDLSAAVSIPDAAQAMNVSPRSVKRAKRILASGNQEIIAKVEAGEMRLNTAINTIDPPKPYEHKRSEADRRTQLALLVGAYYGRVCSRPSFPKNATEVGIAAKNLGFSIHDADALARLLGAYVQDVTDF